MKTVYYQIVPKQKFYDRPLTEEVAKYFKNTPNMKFDTISQVRAWFIKNAPWKSGADIWKVTPDGKKQVEYLWKDESGYVSCSKPKDDYYSNMYVKDNGALMSKKEEKAYLASRHAASDARMKKEASDRRLAERKEDAAKKIARKSKAKKALKPKLKKILKPKTKSKK